MKINPLYEKLLTLEKIDEKEQYLREHEIIPQDVLDYMLDMGYVTLEDLQNETLQDEKT